MNPSPNMYSFLILASIWIVWCSLHSALIAPSVTTYIQKHLPRLSRYYRLFYNLVAVFTLGPVIVYSIYLGSTPFFRWGGIVRLVQAGMLLTAVYLFWAGARHYDLLQFLGFRNIQTEDACSLISENCELETTGILGVVRHPWYAGGILVLWARNLDGSALVINIVLTCYFVFGAWLEERKLLIQFGDAYRTYQREVSMLFPIKWLRVKVFENP